MLLLAALALLPRRAPTYWRPSALLGGKLSELRFSSSSAESSDSVARDDSQAGRTAGSAAPGSSSGQSQQVAAGAAVAVTRSRRASPSDEPSADAVTWLFGEVRGRTGRSEVFVQRGLLTCSYRQAADATGALV